ncbi:MAG: PHP domain-containing protein [Brevinematia bacterium]
MIGCSQRNADLHTHSTVSDGQLSVGLLLKKSQEKNIRYLSITDHENTNQVKEYRKLFSPFSFEIKVIPGVEVSTKHLDQEIHLLAYYSENLVKEVEEIVQPLREEKKNRVMRILEVLKKDRKLENYMEAITYLMSDVSKTFNRMYVARFVYDNLPFCSIEDVFKKYFDNDDVNKSESVYPKTEEVIRKLNSIGCFVGIAHPDFLKDWRKVKYIKYFAEIGVRGIEVFHPLIDENLSLFLLKLCQEINLIPLGGSDFHGYDTKRRELGEFNTFDSSAEAIMEFLCL